MEAYVSVKSRNHILNHCPLFQEALGKLDICFKEFHESLMKTKEAFQLYKVKSFFFPDPEFKSFTESVKQVRLTTLRL